MPLKLLLDENLRFGALINALAAHQATGAYPLDVVRVGDPGCPPLSAADDEILRWAATADRIVVSLDARTLGQALAEYLAAGGRSPGVILLRNRLSVAELLEILLLLCHASGAADWENTLQWLP